MRKKYEDLQKHQKNDKVKKADQSDSSLPFDCQILLLPFEVASAHCFSLLENILEFEEGKSGYYKW